MFPPERVRPQLVWGGLGLALAGLVLLGLGVALASWPWSVAGLVVLGGGAATSLAGGMLRDVHTTSDAAEGLDEVRSDHGHPGVEAGTMLEDPEVRRDALETTRTVDRAVLGTRPRPPRNPAPAVGGILAVLVVVLFAAMVGLVPQDVVGRGNSFRITAVLILLGWGAIALLRSPRPRPAAGVTLVAGAALLTNGLLAEHQEPRLAGVEVACGIVVVVTSILVLGNGRRPRPV